MKKFLLIFCLLLCQFLLAQNDTASVSKPKLGLISVDKLNIVYRGIQNPISIAVPNAKSFTVSGLGVKEENGKYFIVPGQGNEVIVTLEIILEDDSKVIEEHIFRIKNIPRPLGKINNRNCDNYVTMDITELKNAKISVYQDDFLFDWNFEVTSFVIKKEKKPAIIVDGNTINENTLIELNRLKKGDIITIAAIKYKVSPNISGLWPNIPPILILISD
jgi:hypothetical protein